MKILLKWAIFTIAILFAAYTVPNVELAGVWAAVWLAAFLGLINISLKPVLIIITLPINIITLGLFTFVINALMVLLASSVLKGFTVSGFWSAMLFSIVLSAISYILNLLIGKDD